MLRTSLKYIKNLFFPRICLLCRLACEGRICAGCFSELPFISEPVCEKCGAVMRYGGETCPECSKGSRCFEFARAVFEYKDGARRLISEFKYRKKDYLGEYIGGIMADYYRSKNLYFPVDAMAAVPLYHANYRERGFNQAELLSEKLSNEIGIKLLKGVLKRIKKTNPQYSLDKNARRLNMKDAFTAVNQQVLKNKSILLIDDIATTMSTINEAAKALKKAGACKVFAFTFARD